MDASPIRLRCPFCEQPVNKITQTRNFQRRGLSITFWHHANDRCFVVDDLYEMHGPPGSQPFPFEVMVTEVRDAHAAR